MPDELGEMRHQPNVTTHDTHIFRSGTHVARRGHVGERSHAGSHNDSPHLQGGIGDSFAREMDNRAHRKKMEPGCCVIL